MKTEVESRTAMIDRTCATQSRLIEDEREYSSAKS
jgi:hypothetical protein